MNRYKISYTIVDCNELYTHKGKILTEIVNDISIVNAIQTLIERQYKIGNVIEVIKAKKTLNL